LLGGIVNTRKEGDVKEKTNMSMSSKKMDPTVKAAYIGAVAVIIVAIIGLIGAIPVGSSDRPLACSFNASVFNGIYNCNGNVIINGQLSPTPPPNLTETSLAQTLTSVAATQTVIASTAKAVTATAEAITSTPKILIITATSEPEVTIIVATSEASKIPAQPSQTVVVTPELELVELRTSDQGNVVSYTITLNEDEIIVGNANTLNVEGIRRVANSCIVYSLKGPGTYTVSVSYGSIKHYRNVFDENVSSSLFEQELSNLKSYSKSDSISGTCGTDYPIIEVQIP
jgi:hypothetical protein